MKKNKQVKKTTTLGWWSITKKYWKEQAIFFLLTILSCWSAFLIKANALKAIINRKESEPYSFKWDFFSKTLHKQEFKSRGKFIMAAVIITLIACLIVLAHVYYSYYFTNKVAVMVKKKLARKLFFLRDNHKGKKSLAILTHNPRTFSYLILFVPNQIFYMLFDTLLLFTKIREEAKKAGDYSLMWTGIIFWFSILAGFAFLQYLVYKNDQPFQKSLKKETERENFLVNNRDLIIKKNFTLSSLISYRRYLNKSRRAANRRDFSYTLSYVVPSYSLVRMASLFLVPFATSNKEKEIVLNLVELCADTKKMAERLKDFPYGLSARKQINNFLQLPERDDIQKNILISEPIESITLKKVSFGYEKDKPVLEKLDWEFRKGQINHLTEENGFGKSTIISLIMGLYQPQEGEVIINNDYRLDEVNLIAWREKIAYAEHENLVENGLSTGQKQLADLDNLFANSEEKEVFIFDEADNALDKNNKKKFRQKITEISQEKLVILISH